MKPRPILRKIAISSFVVGFFIGLLLGWCITRAAYEVKIQWPSDNVKAIYDGWFKD